VLLLLLLLILRLCSYRCLATIAASISNCSGCFRPWPVIRESTFVVDLLMAG